jgi:TonB family protein
MKMQLLIIACCSIIVWSYTSAERSNPGTEDPCKVARERAQTQFRSGNFYFPEHRTYDHPYYFEEAFYKLYGIKGFTPHTTDIVWVNKPPGCYDLTIDSLLIVQYGSDVYVRVQRYADSMKAALPERYSDFPITEPRYIPNNDSIIPDLRRVIRYPTKHDIEGVVYIRIWIDTTGRIDSTYIMRGVRRDLDSAAIAGVKQLGRFSPALRWGIPQESQYIIPVKFSRE